MESNSKKSSAKRLFENSPPLLTYEELSERIRIPVSTLQKWVMRGKTIPFLKLGRSVRFEAEEVAKWLASRKRGKDVS